MVNSDLHGWQNASQFVPTLLSDEPAPVKLAKIGERVWGGVLAPYLDVCQSGPILRRSVHFRQSSIMCSRALARLLGDAKIFSRAEVKCPAFKLLRGEAFFREDCTSGRRTGGSEAEDHQSGAQNGNPNQAPCAAQVEREAG